MQVGSCCITDSEERYAVIEFELFAVSWAMTCFLVGIPYFEGFTDHNLLIPKIYDKDYKGSMDREDTK